MPRKKWNTDDFIKEIYRKASGEYDDSVTADSEDGRTILSVINEQVDYYYNAVDRFGARVLWVRNIDPEYELGDGNGVDDTFFIDWDEVQALPDGFYMPIAVGDTRYDLVPFEQLYGTNHENTNRCAISMEGLVFVEPPKEGVIRYPCIPYGKHLEGDEKDVEAWTGVHNTLWLMWAAAAEYVRTDIVRGEQYPNVLAQANDVYNRMLEDNDARTQALGYTWGQPQQRFDWE
jgi:hypothetical protein